MCAPPFASSSIGWKLKVPQGDVGITAGSRGIANIAEITRAAGDWLRDHGAKPFLFPAMGSHNGGTAEGQRAMIESLGITEASDGHADPRVDGCGEDRHRFDRRCLDGSPCVRVGRRARCSIASSCTRASPDRCKAGSRK